MAYNKFRELIRRGVPNAHYWACPHGGGGKGDSPDPPDYEGAARAQGAANVQTAIANNIMGRPNESTPYGTRTWNQQGTYTIPGADGNPAIDIPLFQSSVNMTPQGQKRWDQEQRIIGQYGNIAEGGLGRIGKSFGTPFKFNSADDLQNQTEDILMDRLEPRMERSRQQKEDNLMIQGHNRGGQAWSSMQDDIGQQENDQRRQAVVEALKVRPQVMQEELALRNIPLNEVNALRTGSQVQMPQFQSYGSSGAQAPDIMGATNQQYQAQLGQHNAQAAQGASALGGLASLGGAAMMAPAGTFAGF